MLVKHKNELIKALIIVFVLFIVTSLALYCFHSMFGKKRNIIVKYSTDEVIEIQNILPISDKLGKTLSIDSAEDGVQGYAEFSLYNPNKTEVKYEVYLTKINDNFDEIKEDYIKLYFTDGADKAFSQYDLNAVPVYSDLNYLVDKPEAKLLYSGRIVGKETKKLRLRMWLSDSYFLNTNIEKFKCRVNIRMK